MRAYNYTEHDLYTYIDSYDVGAVERVLAIRDDNGVPLVNINNIREHSRNRTAINIAIEGLYRYPRQDQQEERLFQIMQHLLAVRDIHGNPVIDLNIQDYGQSTPLMSILLRNNTNQLSQTRTRILFDTILNLRNNDGSRAYRFEEDTSYPGLLVQAIWTNDPAIVNSIVDLRNANGDFAIDVNRAMPRDYRNQEWLTPFDFALEGVRSIMTNIIAPTDPQIIAILEARGARPSNQNPRPQNNQAIRPPGQRRAAIPPQVQPVAPPQIQNNNNVIRPLAQRDVAIPPQGQNRNQNAVNNAAAQFQANTQNVHSPEVERTVDNSLVSLEERYHTPSAALVGTTLSEIRTYINQRKALKDSHRTSPELDKILNEINYVDSVPFSTHNLSKLDLKQALTIIWQAASDKTAIPDENPNINPEQLIQMRKLALLDALLDNANTYPNRGGDTRSCIGGYRNRIVSSLDKAHPCVTIIATGAELFDYAIEISKSWERNQIKAKPLADQKAILRDWNVMSEAIVNSESVATSNRAHTFLRQNQERMKNALVGTNPRGALTDLLTQAQVNNIVGEDVYYLRSAPIIHRSLTELLTKIEAIYIPQSASPTTTIKMRLRDALKEDATNTLQDHRSFEDDYQWLLHQYALKWEWIESISIFKATKNNLPEDKRAAFEQLATEVTRIETEISQHLLDNKVEISDCKAVFLKHFAASLPQLIFSDAYQQLKSDETFRKAIATLLNTVIPHQPLVQLLTEISGQHIAPNDSPFTRIKKQQSDALKEDAKNVLHDDQSFEDKYQWLRQQSALKWEWVEGISNFKATKNNLPEDKRAAFEQLATEVTRIETEISQHLLDNKVEISDCKAVFLKHFAASLPQLIFSDAYQKLESDETFRKAIATLLNTVIPHQPLVQLLTKISSLSIAPSYSPLTTIKKQQSDALKENAKKALQEGLSFEESYQWLLKQYELKWAWTESIGKTFLTVLRTHFLKAYGFDGYDASTSNVTSADGKTTEYQGLVLPFGLALASFFGLPTRPDSVEDGVPKFTFLQFLKNLIGGWNPVEETITGELVDHNPPAEAVHPTPRPALIEVDVDKIEPPPKAAEKTLSFSQKRWTEKKTVAGLLFTFKILVIAPFKLITLPFKFLLNVLKLVTEFLLPLVSFYTAVLNASMVEGSKWLWESFKGYEVRNGQATYNPSLLGRLFIFPLIPMVALTTALRIAHYALWLASHIGLALTSPEKCARMVFDAAQQLVMSTVGGEWAKPLSFILGGLGYALSLMFSAALWALTLPLALGALVSAFPAILTTLTGVAQLPFVASTLAWISQFPLVYTSTGLFSSAFGTVSTALAATFGPAISALATIISVQIPTVIMTVGITLGLIVIPVAAILSRVADELSNLWAKWVEQAPFAALKAWLSDSEHTEEQGIELRSKVENDQDQALVETSQSVDPQSNPQSNKKVTQVYVYQPVEGEEYIVSENPIYLLAEQDKLYHAALLKDEQAQLLFDRAANADLKGPLTQGARSPTPEESNREAPSTR